MREPGSYRFGDFEVDLRGVRLLRGGEPIALEPRTFRVLVFLIEHRDRLVEKGEILDGVWKRAFVTENALTRAVARLRKALEDDAQEPRYIETAHGLGYRFVAEVEESPEAPKTEREPSRRPLPAARIVVGGAVAIVLVAGVVLLRRQTIQPNAVPEIVAPRQLTTSTARESWPSLSPDGGAVVYEGKREGLNVLLVRALTPGARERLVLTPGEVGLQPAWSPDGETIAYVRSPTAGGLWLVPALGGASRQLTDFGWLPAWSPDGKSLVFQDGTAGYNPHSSAAGPPSVLWLLQVENGTLRRLTEIGNPPGGHGGPVYSTDGRRIAFASTLPGKRAGLWTLSVEGDDLRPVSGPQWPGRPWFSRGGEGLYYTGFIVGFRGLWYVPLASETAEAVRSPVRLLDWPVRQVTLSRDGRRLAFTRPALESTLWSLPLSATTGEATGPPRRVVEETSFRTMMPAFSPDGSQIVYRVAREGRRGEIWLMDADGGNRTLLTTDRGVWANWPSWLADGRSVAFLSEKQGRRALRRMHLPSRRVETLLEIEDEWERPRLSPDGRWVVYGTTCDGATNLWVTAVDGSAQRQLTSYETFAGWPSWSPDGSLIAFEARVGQSMQAGVVPLDGGSPVLLTSGVGQHWPHGWSPDGEHLAVAALRGERPWNLYSLSLTRRELRPLTHFESGYVRYPTWSPLGDQIVFERGEFGGDVFVADLE